MQAWSHQTIILEPFLYLLKDEISHGKLKQLGQDGIRSMGPAYVTLNVDLKN